MPHCQLDAHHEQDELIHDEQGDAHHEQDELIELKPRNKQTYKVSVVLLVPSTNGQFLVLSLGTDWLKTGI